MYVTRVEEKRKHQRQNVIIPLAKIGYNLLEHYTIIRKKFDTIMYGT